MKIKTSDAVEKEHAAEVDAVLNTLNAIEDPVLRQSAISFSKALADVMAGALEHAGKIMDDPTAHAAFLRELELRRS